MRSRLSAPSAMSTDETSSESETDDSSLDEEEEDATTSTTRDSSDEDSEEPSSASSDHILVHKQTRARFEPSDDDGSVLAASSRSSSAVSVVIRANHQWDPSGELQADRLVPSSVAARTASQRRRSSLMIAGGSPAQFMHLARSDDNTHHESVENDDDAMQESFLPPHPCLEAIKPTEEELRNDPNPTRRPLRRPGGLLVLPRMQWGGIIPPFAETFERWELRRLRHRHRVERLHTLRLSCPFPHFERPRTHLTEAERQALILRLSRPLKKDVIAAEQEAKRRQEEKEAAERRHALIAEGGGSLEDIDDSQQQRRKGRMAPPGFQLPFFDPSAYYLRITFPLGSVCPSEALTLRTDGKDERHDDQRNLNTAPDLPQDNKHRSSGDGPLRRTFEMTGALSSEMFSPATYHHHHHQHYEQQQQQQQDGSLCAQKGGDGKMPWSPTPQQRAAVGVSESVIAARVLRGCATTAASVSASASASPSRRNDATTASAIVASAPTTSALPQQATVRDPPQPVPLQRARPSSPKPQKERERYLLVSIDRFTPLLAVLDRYGPAYFPPGGQLALAATGELLAGASFADSLGLRSASAPPVVSTASVNVAATPSSRDLRAPADGTAGTLHRSVSVAAAAATAAEDAAAATIPTAIVGGLGAKRAGGAALTESALHGDPRLNELCYVTGVEIDEVLQRKRLNMERMSERSALVAGLASLLRWSAVEEAATLRRQEEQRQQHPQGMMDADTMQQIPIEYERCSLFSRIHKLNRDPVGRQAAVTGRHHPSTTTDEDTSDGESSLLSSSSTSSSSSSSNSQHHPDPTSPLEVAVDRLFGTPQFECAMGQRCLNAVRAMYWPPSVYDVTGSNIATGASMPPSSRRLEDKKKSSSLRTRRGKNVRRGEQNSVSDTVVSSSREHRKHFVSDTDPMMMPASWAKHRVDKLVKTAIRELEDMP